MYTCTAVGLGQPTSNQDSEEQVLRQLLENGLEINPEIDGRKVHIYLAPSVAKLPYFPKRSPESREYWGLSQDERDKVTATVDRIFRQVTGIVRKLDPKNPKDKPWIRTWLRLRDYVMGFRAKRIARREQPLRKNPPFRTSLGQPATVSKNPWCELTPPRCTTPWVSPGGYGTALLYFTDSNCIPNQVPQLLQSSQRFMNMVKKLDKRYLALHGPEICALLQKGNYRSEEWVPDAAGVLTRGQFRGMRVLQVLWSQDGSSFSPVGSLDNDFDYDIIAINAASSAYPPSASPHNIAALIAHIAHETTHAYNLLHPKGPLPKTIQDRVKAAIADEQDTRQEEAKILAEITATIPNTANGRLLRNAFSGLTLSTDIWQIQRDPFPGRLRRTYLEHFVLSERALEAIKREKLSADEVRRINKEVDELPMRHASTKSIKSEYGRWRLQLRGIDLNWTYLIKRLGYEPPNTDLEKERLLQRHASLFDGLATYDPIP